MIVITCRCRPQPGLEEQARAAARTLMANSQGHPGLLAYFWNSVEGSDDMVLVEVHEDEASVVTHIGRTDFAPLGRISTLSDIRVHGDAPGPRLREVLSHFGRCDVYTVL